MAVGKSSKLPGLLFMLALWALAAWLIYPLINLDHVTMHNAKQFLYRSALGLALLIIFFGKTLYDLLFPQPGVRKMSLLNGVLLTLYSLALAGGIVFMFMRVFTLYIKSQKRPVGF